MSEVGENEGVAGGSSPLDAILGSGAPEPVQPETPSQESAEPDAQPLGEDDAPGEPRVSLLALHRERERRQKMDAKVRQLEEELQRYNEQKWGLEPQQEKSQEAQPDKSKEWEQRAFAYNQSYAKFVADHGKDKVQAIDAAIGNLSPQQKAHVIALATQGDGDAVERVHQYVLKLGLLEDKAFKPASLQDVLSGKKDEPKPTEPPYIANLDARERAIFDAERRTTYNASRAEFVSEYGKARFEQLDAAATQLMNSNHPAAEAFVRAVTAHDSPVEAAARMLGQLGLWQPDEAPPPRQQQIMPSNFAGARSVSSRGGPAFSGPTPLADIFKR